MLQAWNGQKTFLRTSSLFWYLPILLARGASYCILADLCMNRPKGFPIISTRKSIRILWLLREVPNSSIFPITTGKGCTSSRSSNTVAYEVLGQRTSCVAQACSEPDRRRTTYLSTRRNLVSIRGPCEKLKSTPGKHGRRYRRVPGTVGRKLMRISRESSVSNVPRKNGCFMPVASVAWVCLKVKIPCAGRWKDL